MRRDIIKISTFTSSATGFLLPCEYDDNEESREYYIFFTTLHVLFDYKNISIKTLEENISKNISLEIFNSNGMLVKYEIIDCFIGDSLCNEDDIFTVLISINKEEKFHFNRMNICKSEWNKVQTCGFPSALNGERIINQFALHGEKITTFDSNMAVYKIIDTYHHYVDFYDLKVLEGFSGAPVYTSNNEIIGMNQSIPAMGSGENPFKLVYIIKIIHVLEYLRGAGCILFDITEKESKIIWIKNTKYSDKELSILVIGGSGAGKSTFINNFALHKRVIDAAGDGQTTRTDVEYAFSRYIEQPKATVKFLNEEDFKGKMNNFSILKIISFIFTERYGFDKYDIEDDQLIYFRVVKKQMDLIEKKGILDSERIRVTIDILGSIEVDKETIVKNYISLFQEIEQIDGKYQKKMKLVFSESKLEKILEEILILGPQSKDIIKQIFEGKKLELFNLSSREEILKKIVSIILNINEDEEIEKLFKDIFYETNQSVEERKRNFEKLFLEQKGFFDICEFDFILKEKREKNQEEFEKKIENFLNSIIQKGEQNGEFVEKLEDESKEIFKELYAFIYKNLHYYLESSSLLDEFGIEKCDKDSLTFTFDELSIKGKRLLSRCLKVVNKYDSLESLTGIISKVVIEDSYSNKYAVMFSDLNIKEIRFHDTYGLDHIEKGHSKKAILNDFFSTHKEEREKKVNSEKGMLGIDAVFYLKKLDSGRPTELETIIPIIYDIEPRIALYCIFTGADIITSCEDNEIIDWKSNEEKIPKAVKYINSKELKEVICEKLSFSKEKNECIVNTLAKNVGVFSGSSSSRFDFSNKKHIEKIMTSIIIKEKDSIDILDVNDIEMKIKGNENIIEEINKLIILLFEKATVADWRGINGNTVKANARRTNSEIDNERTFGYKGSGYNSRYRLDILLIAAYKNVFSNTKYTKRLIDEINQGPQKIEAILLDLMDDFLGRNTVLYQINNYKNNEFRNLLEELYKGMDENPFDNSQQKTEIGKDQNRSREYLGKVFNFRLLIKENEEVLNKMSELFLNLLIERIKISQDESLENILNYQKGIKDKILQSYNDCSEFFNREITPPLFETIVKRILEEEMERKNRP